MKRIAIVVSALGFCGVLWGATLNIAATSPISVMTLTQVGASTPTYVGQPVICSNCGSVNGALGTICIATGTAQNAWIIAGSSLTATTACK